jgi:hypothetical protein
MALTRLIYASRETAPLESGDIAQILDASRRNNLIDGVTGMLCHGNGRFLQYLEGDDAAVRTIYARIEKDPRHADIVLIESREEQRRVFGDWSMGFVDATDMWTQVTIRETAKMDVFLPDRLDSGAESRLIRNLKAALQAQVII